MALKLFNVPEIPSMYFLQSVAYWNGPNHFVYTIRLLGSILPLNILSYDILWNEYFWEISYEIQIIWAALWNEVNLCILRS